MIYSINEGQQAEEYKARKAKEAKDSEKREKEHYYKRHAIPSYRSEDMRTPKFVGDKGNTLDREHYQKYVDKDMDRYERSVDLLSREFNRRKAEGDTIGMRRVSGRAPQWKDAINRHMRRHPDQYKESCGIFSSIAFI